MITDAGYISIEFLQKIIETCKASGVQSVKVDEVEVTFFANQQEVDANPVTGSVKFPDPDLKMPSDDEMLGYSSPLDIEEKVTQ